MQASLGLYCSPKSFCLHMLSSGVWFNATDRIPFSQLFWQLLFCMTRFGTRMQRMMMVRSRNSFVFGTSLKKKIRFSNLVFLFFFVFVF